MDKIRQATVDDAKQIGKVHVASWQSAYLGIIPKNILDSQSEVVRASFWRRFLSEGGWPVFVAIAADDIVGFASCIPCRDSDLSEDSVCELAAVYLLERVARRGIGTLLLDRCSVEAVERGFDSMTLWVLEENVQAQAFYVSCGFKPDGALKHDARLHANEIRMCGVLPL